MTSRLWDLTPERGYGYLLVSAAATSKAPRPPEDGAAAIPCAFHATPVGLRPGFCRVASASVTWELPWPEDAAEQRRQLRTSAGANPSNKCDSSASSRISLFPLWG